MISELVTKCANGGDILVAQTTFVEIECVDSKTRFRIHYKEKHEFNVKLGHFGSLQLFDSHPLLIQYREPIETIYLSSKVNEKQKFISLLEEAALEHFEGWRSLYSYINSGFVNRLEEFLDGGFGILMDAPCSFTERVMSIAKSVGVDLHTRLGSIPTNTPQLLIMDGYFVIAESFRAYKMEERPG